MARARNIKPAFFQNEELGELLPIERLAFIGMWTVADFRGCIELKLKRLKVQLLPYDECDMELIVNVLEKARFIRTYSVQGQRYIKIINFEKHQNPHKNERDAGSGIPDFFEDGNLHNENSDLYQDGTKPDFIGSTRADSLLLIPDTLIPLTAKNPSREVALVVSHDFETFWHTYPKKVGKDAALKSWNKAKPLLDDVLNALHWQRDSEQWKRENGKYIPNPSTYINQGRWKDEAPVEELW